MPSSLSPSGQHRAGGPAPAFVRAELPDLSTRPAHRPAPAEATPFTATGESVPAALFEVSATAGVPEQLLAPARAAAEAAGYAAGWAHGVQAARTIADGAAHAATTARARAEAQRAAEVTRALAALDAAAGELERRAAPSAQDVEALIVASALEIAEALVGCTLHDDTNRGRIALSRALALTPAGEDVVVALSPADYAAVNAETVNGASEGAFGRAIRLTADPALTPGDAIATSGATIVDARISEGLARVRDLLTPSSSPLINRREPSDIDGSALLISARSGGPGDGPA